MSPGGLVPDGADVTQTGYLNQSFALPWSRQHCRFRSGLRINRDEKYLSAIEGRLDPTVAVPLVCRGDSAGSADAVRYATVGSLRSAGFEVNYQLSRTIPGHVGITWNGDWDLDVSTRIDNCFADIRKGPG